MKVIPTKFEGLFVIEPSFHKDNRGGFYEAWREEDYKQVGINEEFLQDNVSISHGNVLRGLHYQKDQAQLVTVTYGEIFDVVVDIRPYSKTYKKYFSINLSADSPQQLYMPSGFAHGFCVLSKLAIVNYKCTQYYDAENEGGIIWNDPEFRIRWPRRSFTIGQRDQQLKMFKDIK